MLFVTQPLIQSFFIVFYEAKLCVFSKWFKNIAMFAKQQNIEEDTLKDTLFC